MRTLLIVDDEPEILMLSRLAFRRDFRVLTAMSGQEGLMLLEAEAIDLVVTDQRMPDMKGTDMLREAFKHRPGLPCILSTGYTQDADMLEAVHTLGVARVVFKPWSPSELLRHIHQILAEHDATH